MVQGPNRRGQNTDDHDTIFARRAEDILEDISHTNIALCA